MNQKEDCKVTRLRRDDDEMIDHRLAERWWSSSGKSVTLMKQESRLNKVQRLSTDKNHKRENDQKVALYGEVNEENRNQQKMTRIAK